MIRMEVMMDIISFDMVKVCIVNLKFVGIEKVRLVVWNNEISLLG